MAELLVKAIDTVHADPIKNERGCYKRGDIVDIREDGFEWGKEEISSKFVVVKCSNIKVDDVKQYMNPHTQKTITQDKDGNFIEETTILKRRQFSIDLDKYDGKDLTSKKLNSLIKDKSK
jgi:hypothetical protein